MSSAQSKPDIDEDCMQFCDCPERGDSEVDDQNFSASCTYDDDGCGNLFEGEKEAEFHFNSLSTPGDYNLEFSIAKETDIFVILVNNNPKCYAKTYDCAQEQIWVFARELRKSFPEYTTYIREGPKNDTIEVVGFYKFFLVSYDRVLVSLKIVKIQELNMDEGKVSEEDVPDQMKDCSMENKLSTPEPSLNKSQKDKNLWFFSS